jgi:acetyltransferase-like isoleucine patch superfamily enzyme
MPIFIYGPIKFKCLSGKILLTGKIRPGLVKFGYDFTGFPKYNNTKILDLKGDIVFEGFAFISIGTLISAWEGATIIIGNGVMIGSGTVVKSVEKIEIGRYTRITDGCVIFDGDIHYIKDLETGSIKRNRGKIVIGNHCWINSNVTIGKNVTIPNYSIIAKQTIVNQSFKEKANYLFIGGIPAKIIKQGVQKIFSYDQEFELDREFMKNPSLIEVQKEPGTFEDELNEKYFKKSY